jgi:Ca2+-binding EF-hand superfamily protein
MSPLSFNLFLIKEKNKKMEEDDFIKKIPSFSKRDILSIPGIKENPVSVFLIKKFTVNEKLDTKALVISLYRFSKTKNLEEKLFFLFEIYDSDSDGFIFRMELFNFLKLLNKGILDDYKLNNIVDRTFADAGEYIDKMNFDQFKKLINSRCINLRDMFGCY